MRFGTILIVAALLLCASAARAVTLDPFAFPSLGVLDLTSGRYVLDPAGGPGGLPVLSGPSGLIATGTQYASIAPSGRKVGIFDFDLVTIGAGVVIDVSAPDPVGFLSRTTIDLKGQIIDPAGDFILGTPFFAILGPMDAPRQDVPEPRGWMSVALGLIGISLRQSRALHGRLTLSVARGLHSACWLGAAFAGGGAIASFARLAGRGGR